MHHLSNLNHKPYFERTLWRNFLWLWKVKLYLFNLNFSKKFNKFYNHLCILFCFAAVFVVFILISEELLQPKILLHFCISPHLCSAWSSSTTHRPWVTSWRSLWRKTTCWWPIRSALTCMRAPVSSSSLLSSRTWGLLEHLSQQSRALQTLALCPHQTKTGGQGKRITTY